MAELEKISSSEYAIDGNLSRFVGMPNFREGLSTYTSKTKTLVPPPGRDQLYRGEIATLPNLPSI